MKQQTEQNKILLKMLRERQQKQNIRYLTTKHNFYKFCKVMFRLLLVVCTALNIIFLISQWSSLQVTLANAGDLSDLQQQEVSEMKNGIYSVGVLSIVMLFSELFLDIKKPLFKIAFSLIPGILLLTTYASRLSDALDAGDYSSFIWKHLVPIGLFMLFALMAGIIHLRQLYKDKKGMNEISEEIYKRYSVLAENITPEQWETILADYQPAKPKSKKRSVKARLRKESAKNTDTEKEPTEYEV